MDQMKGKTGLSPLDILDGFGSLRFLNLKFYLDP